jgi:hypothetical protein
LSFYLLVFSALSLNFISPEWFFVMPNLRVVCKGKSYNGVMVGLHHDYIIFWDGCIIQQWTSVTNPGVGDNG